MRREGAALCLREAVDSMDGLRCSLRVLRRLKDLVVSALNAPSNWTEDQVSDLGNIIGEVTIRLLHFLTQCVVL